MQEFSNVKGYGALTQYLCVNLGFCGCIKDGKPSHIDDYIPRSGKVSADQFVDWVFLAENMDPISQPTRLQRQIRSAFVEYLGHESVDVEALDHKFE